MKNILGEHNLKGENKVSGIEWMMKERHWKLHVGK